MTIPETHDEFTDKSNALWARFVAGEICLVTYRADLRELEQWYREELRTKRLLAERAKA